MLSQGMRPQLKGTLLVALSGTLFGLLGYLGTQLIHNQFSIENMLFWRFLIATMWIMSWLLLRERQLLFPALNHASLPKVFILGAISYSGSSVFYFLASKHIGTGIAMVIFYSFPIFVALLAWLLDNWKINKYAFTCLIAVMLGLFLLKGSDRGAVSVVGISFAVVAAVSYAAYVYGSQHTIKNIDTRMLTFLVCIGNTLIFFALSLYSHTLSFPVNLSTWGYILAIGILATALPIQLLLDGLKYISPLKASLLSMLEPVITMMIGFEWLDESLSGIQLLGVLIVLLGAIFIQFERQSGPHPVGQELI